MGKPDFLGNWCLHRQPRPDLRLKDVKIGEWVMVIYKDKMFLRKVLSKKKKGKMQVRCLEKSYDITGLQDFKLLEDTIFYTEVFNPEVAPRMFFFFNWK